MLKLQIHDNELQPQPAVPTGPPPVVLVFFIGGITYTEIAALRWLSKQPGTLFLRHVEVALGQAYFQ